MANENTENTETDTTPRERKTWQFGHFQTKHDGKRWRLVRTHSTRGWKLFGDDRKVVASNKSATPLVALARETSRVEKRDIRRRRALNQIADLRETVAVIDAEIAAEAAPVSEVA
jgi:hypothetical protein